MAGRWVYRAAEQHRCRPTLDNDSRSGDVWHCDCGTFWVVNETQADGKYFATAKPNDLIRAGIDVNTAYGRGKRR